MPTAQAYLEAVAAYVVWMLLYLFLKAGVRPILSFAEQFGGSMVADPVSWVRSIINYWPLLGLVGLFVALLAAGISARNGRSPQMGLVKRAGIIATWLTALSIYLAIIGAGLTPLYSYARSMGAQQTEFWWLLDNFKYLSTNLIPAVLICGPVVTWVYGVIRQETTEYAAVRP